MKVRLKHGYLNGNPVSSLFQFHEGPIKTQLGVVSRVVVMRFNSMKVRLKRRAEKVFVPF